MRHACGALCRPSCQWLDLVQGAPTQEVAQSTATAPPLLLATALRNALLDEVHLRPMGYKALAMNQVLPYTPS